MVFHHVFEGLCGIFTPKIDIRKCDRKLEMPKGRYFIARVFPLNLRAKRRCFITSRPLGRRESRSTCDTLCWPRCDLEFVHGLDRGRVSPDCKTRYYHLLPGGIWDSLCRFRWSLRLKPFAQPKIGHLYGLSPLWPRSGARISVAISLFFGGEGDTRDSPWPFSASFRLYPFSQPGTEHLYGLVLLWTCFVARISTVIFTEG